MARVIIHTFHESEKIAASSTLSSVSAVTDSYQIGELDTVQIQNLEAQGLIVEVLDDADADANERERERDAQPGSRELPQLDSTELTVPAVHELQNPVVERIGAREEFYLTIRDPLISEWREELDQHDVVLLERVQTDRYLARIPLLEVTAVRALPYVHAVNDVDPPISGSRGLDGVGGGETAAEAITMDLVVRSAQQLTIARDLLTELGVIIIGEGQRKIRFEIPVGNTAEATLRQHTDLIEQLAQYIEPRLHNDVAGELMSVRSNTFHATLDGAAQLVGIADTGLDEAHPDFAGRLVTAIARGRPGDSSDLHGHGTHVAGSMLGDGSASTGEFGGIAPKAKFVFQSLMDGRGRLSGLPVDLHELFQEAFDHGVKIHNNSWGADVGAEYVLDANEADGFVRENPDMLIVTSAGNSAVARGINEPAGIVDLLSMGSLGAGKNLLTVGASRSSRTTGGRSTKTYGQLWPRSFPDPPIRDETVSGDSSKLAGFSSRGPMLSSRIKPDIVAPGTDIVSARSSLAPDGNFWGNHANKSYGYMGGTSMASPLAAGVATLVRQYYEQRRNHIPTAALLKATMINGTQRLNGDQGTAWQDAYPNPHQGFGALNYAATVPDIELFGLEFIDRRNSAEEGFTRSGQRARFAIRVTGERELRVCLVYTDYAGRGSQNGLSLFVEQPDRQKVLGNAERFTNLIAPDSVNNVQIVRIQTPAPGVYSLFVQARNILFAPQDFSLVVTGELDPPLNEF